ncbi:MAG: hypothetical protein M1815_003424 [Lichina confinis]|nr:MAG: hypothetical protein M1815_003424 [Lichina confinis]
MVDAQGPSVASAKVLAAAMDPGPVPYRCDRAVALVKTDDGENDAGALVLDSRPRRTLGMRQARAERQVVESPERLFVKVSGPTRPPGLPA